MTPPLADYGVTISTNPLPENEPKYELLRDNLTYGDAIEYVKQNYKTHPKEKLWFFLIPGAGLFRIMKEVTEN